MTMSRIVAVETLDGLAIDDPAAMRSRRDLRRVHLAMGTRAILLRALHDSTASLRKDTPLRVLELGAGDGTLMLGVAQALAPTWLNVELTVLDRQLLIDHKTIKSYADVGWNTVEMVVDVFDWAADANASLPTDNETTHWDLIVANLFLHHFEDAQLTSLLNKIASRTNRFFACEPRRSWLALAGSHLVGAIGANSVTRKDAVLSVHAGFCGNELTMQWPVHGVEWNVHEYSAGLFSHCFCAKRFVVN